MTLTRIYLPLNAARLRELAAGGVIAGRPLRAHAVTEAVRAAQPAGDEEEREYAALCDAASSSRLLLEAGESRRIVAAADVDSSLVQEAAPGEAATPSTVEVSEAVPLRRIASFHVDEDGADEDDELLWYDATELSVLVDLI